jgi:hypothetical protein
MVFAWRGIFIFILRRGRLVLRVQLSIGFVDYWGIYSSYRHPSSENKIEKDANHVVILYKAPGVP